MKKTLLALVACAALALALTGCGGNLTTDDGDRSVMSEHDYELKDGRTVTCIIGSGRLSCDWEGAR